MADLVELRGEQLEELLLQGLQALGGHHDEADADVGGVTGEAGDLLDARQLDARQVDVRLASVAPEVNTISSGSAAISAATCARAASTACSAAQP